MPATRKTATAKPAAKTTAKPKPAPKPAPEVVDPVKVAKISGRTPKRIDPAKAVIVGTALGFGLHAAGLM
jgi:hypothetical protein